MTPKQIAAEAGVVPSTVRRWLGSGKLKGRKHGTSGAWSVDPAVWDVFKRRLGK